MSFSSLPPAIAKAIAEMGYDTPTPIQQRAIPLIEQRRDVIGIAQTGTGKTAAFALPILAGLAKRKPKAQGTRALIIAPTRELVTQIREAFCAFGKDLPLRVAALYGGVGEGPQIAALQAHTEIIIATPGRLIDLADQGHVDLRALEYLVLDEADRMLDMGFLPDIRKVVRKAPKHRQTLLFSATLSGQIERLAREFLTKAALVEIGTRRDPAKTVRQAVYEVPKHLRFDLLLHLLENQELFTVLIFVSTKAQAATLAKHLSQSKVPAEAIHGDRSQNQRQRALDKFREGKLRVLVGTDVAARGLDISGVTHVINYDFPLRNEDYIHRIGRTGRADAEGDALTFVTPADGRALHLLQKHIQREINRETAPGFDYDVPPPMADEKKGPRRRPAQKRGKRR